MWIDVDTVKPLDPDLNFAADAEAARKWVTRLATEMGPRGTDEGTKHALDNMINTWADQWLAEIETDRLNALTTVDGLVGQTSAKEQQLRITRDSAVARLREAEENHSLLRRSLTDGLVPTSGGTAEGDGRGIAATARLRSLPAGTPGSRYIDTTLIVGGRPLAKLVEFVVLLLAAGADVVAFYTALSIGLNTPTHLLYLLVAGFTAVALLLSHACGRVCRDLSQGAPGAHRLVLYVCLAGWAGLGIAAFLARLLLGEESSGPSFGGSGTADEMDSSAVLVTAILFAALYLGTGTAAAVVAYWNHNSLANAYAVSERRLAHARQAAAKEIHRYEKVVGEFRQRYNEWWRTEKNHVAARAKRLALAEELKQLARQRMAAAAQDPATTDGLFTEDWYHTERPLSPYRELPKSTAAYEPTQGTSPDLHYSTHNHRS